MHVPTGLLVKAAKTSAKLLAIAAAYSILVILFVPGLFSSRCGPLSGRQISQSLLYSIVQAHIVNAESSLQDGTLPFESIRRDLAPSWYSRSVEPRYVFANQWNRRVAGILNWSVLAIGPALALIVFTKHWVRTLAIVMGSVCALLVLFVLVSTYIVGRGTRTTSYAYVNDYVFVSNVDWRRWASSPMDGIVAFEKNPWPGSWRVVAKNPWTIRIIKESEFQRLLSQQPVAKRAWDDCIAVAECTKVSK